jgi:small subunit ribosomal protein S3
LGQKTHPIGFRLGTTIPWSARWFAARGTGYSALAVEDQNIRALIKNRYMDTGGISKVEIERDPQELIITIHTARPGIVIGRGGTRVDELRGELETLTGKRARLNIQEIRTPELDAYLVARNVAEQLERRVAFRRAMRQAVTRTMQSGADGIKLICAGRLGGAEIARSEKAMDGRVPLHTLRANIDFAIAEAATTFGRIGVKVWIYKGDVAGGAALIGAATRQIESSTPSADGGEGRPRRRRSGPGGGGRSGGGRSGGSGGRGGTSGGRRRGDAPDAKPASADTPPAAVPAAEGAEATPEAPPEPKAAESAPAPESSTPEPAPDSGAAPENGSTSESSSSGEEK